MAWRQVVAAIAGCLALAVGGATTAQAQEAFGYSRTGPGMGGSGKHVLEFFELHYADNGINQGFSGKIDFKPEVVKGDRQGGFWLVVSDGPNPKGDIGEYAILYGDLKNNRITAYEYNGQNGPSSFSEPGNFLQSFDNDPFTIDTDTGEVSFQIDVTSINAAFLNDPTRPDYDGIKFGQGTHKIGVWFHFSEDLRVNYEHIDGNLELTKFNLRHQGYVDFQNKPATKKDCADLPPDFPGCTTEISEPATLALLGLGLVGLAVTRRRHSA
ncbi:MAG: PEP-CTERM sorting domain-containing protein [Sphingomonadales bacterium]